VYTRGGSETNEHGRSTVHESLGRCSLFLSFARPYRAQKKWEKRDDFVRRDTRDTRGKKIVRGREINNEKNTEYTHSKRTRRVRGTARDRTGWRTFSIHVDRRRVVQYQTNLDVP